MDVHIVSHMTLGEDHVIMIAMLHSLQRIIWFAHVDEKVPVPFFQDCLDFFNGSQQHLKQWGSAPNSGYTPSWYVYVGERFNHFSDLTIEIVWTLWEEEKEWVS